MKLIFKYLTPYALLVGLCLLLLFGQAVTDLSLPNLMSDIVNTGIQYGGIEEDSPVVISENGMTLLQFFMSDTDKATFAQNYTMVKAGEGTSSLAKSYPETKNTNFYVRKDGTEEDSTVSTAYSRATYAFLLYMKDMQAKQGSPTESTSANEMVIHIEDFYSMIPMFASLPEGMLDSFITQANETDSLLQAQVGIAFTRLFYQEMGADLEAVQSWYIIQTGLKMLGITLLGVLAAVIVGFLAARISAAIGKKMRHDIFEKVSKFSNSEFDKFSTASLITRTTNDVQQVLMLIVMGIRMVCYAPIMGIGGIIMAVGKSVSMSWIIAVAVIAILGLILVIFAIALPKFKALQKLMDKLNLVSRENLSGLMVIRAFGNEKTEEKRFEQANRDLALTNRFVQRTMSFMMPAMTLIMNLITLVIVWAGAHSIAASTLQIGDMMAFMQYAMQIIMSFLMIAMMFVMIPRASVSAVRISEVLNCDPEIVDKKQTKTIANQKCTLHFDKVCFRYHNAEEDVLQDISFTAKSGETTAFIGATGSGKSTLIQLIPRFYDVTEGTITIDGIDIREIAQKELHDKIGYVPQKGVLFSGDIASNIRYGKENADREELEKAIEVAQAKEFVDSKEEGLESPISQEGANVSGGQKQRLSIARALVKKPPIYIFDDSFSALDFKTDAALRSALKKYTGDATVLIVAQRVSTIMNAEQIIVLDSGKMVGKGTHKELLATCPTYREIAESQLSKEELA